MQFDGIGAHSEARVTVVTYNRGGVVPNECSRNITDAGLRDLKDMTQLKFLSVIGTKITAAGVEELHRALPTVRIRR